MVLRPPDPTIAPSLRRVSEQFRDWKKSREYEQASFLASNTVSSPTMNSRRARNGLKVSVLSWDVAHNPMGRAHLIADMLIRKFDAEVVGARFPKFGNEVWEPVRNGTVPTIDFAGESFPGHFTKMEEMAKQIDGDVIFVSKPRLPSYELGILAKHFRNRPLILDVDDYELSFVDAHEALTLEEVKECRRDGDFFNPYGRVWTQYCESIISRADHITVSNVELQKKYGGTILPHAKDERVFDPTLYDRASIRAKFGFSADDKVVLFMGTPRMHKGVVEIAEALEKIGNPKYKLCIIGTVTDRNLHARLGRLKDDRIRLISNQPRRDLPANLVVGDLVCLLQDPESEIAKYQMPSRFTDALAMEVPLLATDVPPLANLAASGLVELLDGVPLDQKIDEIFSNHDAYKQRAVENREVFLDEYSYAATVPKIESIIASLLEGPPLIAREFEDLLEFHREVFASLSPSDGKENLEEPQPEISSQPRRLAQKK
jgi:glycosyltransferase involved in cell wall biosynthesis